MSQHIPTDENMEKYRYPTPPKEPAPPPAYVADTPNLTAAFSNLNLSDSAQKPTRDACIAHLKLLEAFHQLREDVATKDGLFGIWDSFVPAAESERDRMKVLLKIREKRWAIYVAKAASRFETWWQTSIQPRATMLQQRDVENPFTQNLDPAQTEDTLRFTKDNLPPIDVIMVWHSYMLNPRDFLEDCLRYGKLQFWKTGLPWAAIDSCIDNDSFEICASQQAQELFEAATKSAWDSLNDKSTILMPCPKCKRQLECPWTTCNNAFFQEADGGFPEVLGHGLADKQFELSCQFCGVIINHGVLRTQKFRRDLEQLLLNDVPMPGTILNVDGVSTIMTKSLSTAEVLFPNRLIKLGLGSSLLECTNVQQHKTTTVNDIRTELETALRDRSLLQKATQRGFNRTGRLLREEKVAVRRMMSRYWDNSSTFALDLIGAVVRQGSFIEKMNAIDWIHSPTVGSTMTRFIDKYYRYVEIIARHPAQMAVPTLDVDLVWHTHQLSPKSYYEYSLRKTSIFIDHDDKINENKLSTAFEWTSKTYQKIFHSVYSECTCWYCEATRETSSSFVTRHTKHYKEAEAQLDRIRSSKGAANPHTGPHISAHNAINASSPLINASMTTAQLESNYQKASKRARKRGHEPPPRDNYMYAMAYGYPLYLPYYAPYMGDPCTSDSYPSNPACADLAIGAAGNCCQGACAGGIASGACGGVSGGACGSGGGGCGGGGGGGGCCGGGGGGGGGCGGGGGGGC